MPGCPTNLDNSRARAYCACGRRGWCCLDIFSLVYLFFLPLWQTARYRLKNCLKGPLNQKQPIIQPTILYAEGGGRVVLGKLPVPGRPTILIIVVGWLVVLGLGAL